MQSSLTAETPRNPVASKTQFKTENSTPYIVTDSTQSYTSHFILIKILNYRNEPTLSDTKTGHAGPYSINRDEPMLSDTKTGHVGPYFTNRYEPMLLDTKIGHAGPTRNNKKCLKQ